MEPDQLFKSTISGHLNQMQKSHTSMVISATSLSRKLKPTHLVLMRAIFFGAALGSNRSCKKIIILKSIMTGLQQEISQLFAEYFFGNFPKLALFTSDHK